MSRSQPQRKAAETKPAATPPRIFLTGPRRVGKSTVVQAVLSLGLPVRGYVTRRIQSGAVGGFDILLLPGGRRLPLARDTLGARFRLGTRHFNVEIFDTVLAEHLLKEPATASVLVIDELGLVELGQRRFRSAVDESLRRPGPVLGVVQLRALPHWAPLLVEHDIQLVFVDVANRDKWCDRLPLIFAASLGRLRKTEKGLAPLEEPNFFGVPGGAVAPELQG